MTGLLDLDAWLDCKTFLLTSPERLILIGEKIRDGIALTHAERNYLYKYRKREQKNCFKRGHFTPFAANYYSGSTLRLASRSLTEADY